MFLPSPSAASHPAVIDTTHAPFRALMHSRLDYCNGVLAGLPINQVTRLQSILHATARLVLRLLGWADWPDEGQPSLAWCLEANCLQTLCSVYWHSSVSHHRCHVCRRRRCRVVSTSDQLAQTPHSFREQGQKRSGPEVSSMPAQLHGTITPMLLESWTNRCQFSRKPWKCFFFEVDSLQQLYFMLPNSYYSYTFSLSIFWQLLWAPPRWTFIRSSVFSNVCLQLQLQLKKYTLWIGFHHTSTKIFY